MAAKTTMIRLQVFQFHEVQLKAGVTVPAMINRKFQFHEVQLKVSRLYAKRMREICFNSMKYN